MPKIPSEVVDESSLPFIVTEEKFAGFLHDRFTVRERFADGSTQIVGITGYAHYPSCKAGQAAARKALVNKEAGGTYQCPIL